MTRSSAKNQWLGACSVSLASFLGGILQGWSSPVFPLLSSNETPLPCGPISANDLSWVISINMVGCCFGCIIVGYLADTKGRKWCLGFSTIPIIIGWICIYFAQNVYYLIIARFLMGFGGGFSLVAGPIYVIEIAENRLRGNLGSCCVMSNHIGCLFVYVIGHFFSFKVSTLIITILPVLMLILVLNLPETPYYLMKQNKIEEAEKSLAFFRNIKTKTLDYNENYKLELEAMKNQHSYYMESDRKEMVNPSVEWKDFLTPKAKRGMFLALGLCVLNQLCGSGTIISYASIIFAESGSTLTPNISAIVVGLIQVAGSTTTTILVDRLGRKILLIISSSGTGIGLSVMAGYGYLKSMSYDVSAYEWVPLISVAFAIYIVSWGAVTLTFLLISEVLPEKIRSSGSAISITFLWILGFITTKFFYVLSEIIGMHGVMLTFASFSFLGVLFCMRFLPETKGKSLKEIEDFLSK